MHTIDHTWTLHPDGFHSLETLALNSDNELVAAMGMINRRSKLGFVASAGNRCKVFRTLPKAKAWAEAQTAAYINEHNAPRY